MADYIEKPAKMAVSCQNGMFSAKMAGLRRKSVQMSTTVRMFSVQMSTTVQMSITERLSTTGQTYTTVRLSSLSQKLSVHATR
jgi:hypothetical protein